MVYVALPRDNALEVQAWDAVCGAAGAASRCFPATCRARRWQGRLQALTYVQDDLSDNNVFHLAACSSGRTAPAGRGMAPAGPLGAVGSAGSSAARDGVTDAAGAADEARPRSAWDSGSRCAGAPASPLTTLPSWRSLAPPP